MNRANAVNGSRKKLPLMLKEPPALRVTGHPLNHCGARAPGCGIQVALVWVRLKHLHVREIP